MAVWKSSSLGVSRNFRAFLQRDCISSLVDSFSRMDSINCLKVFIIYIYVGDLYKCSDNGGLYETI